MNKQELIDAVSAVTGDSKSATAQVIDAFTEIVGAALAKGDTVTVGPKDEAKADNGAVVDNLLPKECHAAAATTTRAASAASAGTSWRRWMRAALVDAAVLPTSSE